MSRGDEAPIFKADANAKLVAEIAPPKPDPRRAKVSRVHAEIARRCKDGSIYRDDKPRPR